MPSITDPKVAIWANTFVAVINFADPYFCLTFLAISKLKTLKGVYGNIDGHDLRNQFPEYQIFICQGVKVLITHIGGYPGRYNARVKKLINKEKPELYVCGHSHILKVMYDSKNKLLHMNPGACGIQGFHRLKTMLRFELNRGKIKNIEAIELGKRESIIASDQ